jgi:hypothetical protein
MSGTWGELTAKELYPILVNTRNLEIGLFWQRSNYFLALNSAIAFGFFNLHEARYVWIFALLGLLSSLLWVWVCLGSKYWQTRWEQRLMDFENEISPGLAFFSALPDRIRSDVQRGFDFGTLGLIQRSLYDLAKRRKPSVSYSMIRLAGIFVIGWLALIVVLAFADSPVGG